MRRFFSPFTGVLLFLAHPANAVGDVATLVPANTWRLNLKWYLEIEQYSRSWMKAGGTPLEPSAPDHPVVESRFPLSAPILSQRRIGESQCGQLDFVIFHTDVPNRSRREDSVCGQSKKPCSSLRQ